MIESLDVIISILATLATNVFVFFNFVLFCCASFSLKSSFFVFNYLGAIFFTYCAVGGGSHVG